MRGNNPERTAFQSSTPRRQALMSSVLMGGESDFTLRHFGVLSYSCFPVMPPNKQRSS